MLLHESSPLLLLKPRAWRLTLPPSFPLSLPGAVFTARGALITLLSALPSSLLPAMLLRPGRLFYAVTGFCVAFCYIGGLFSNNLRYNTSHSPSPALPPSFLPVFPASALTAL